MKNSSVKVMVRNQFNLEKDVDLYVENLYSDWEGYFFKVWWIDSSDILSETEFKIPHLHVHTKTLPVSNYEV